VVVQVGWNPHQRGIAEAKREQGFRYISLVHDLIPVKLPHLVNRGDPARFAEATLEQIQISDLILVNSKSTAKDLDEFAKERAADLPPTHLLRFGSEVRSPQARCDAVHLPGLSEGEAFVLIVSAIDPRKNHRILYHVWRRLVQEFGEQAPKLVIVGFPEVPDLVHEVRHDPLVKDKVLVLYPIDDGQLDWLYRNCRFTVYPSFYEGWGLPIGESLWYGKLCISSNTSSMPEIGGDLVDYHDPDDLEGCYRLICRAAFDSRYRNRREEQIRTEYRPTTWRECAESLCEAIRGNSRGSEPGPKLLSFPGPQEMVASAEVARPS
jgi:glycosyltransferase involved in cell wall biosynthesis